MKFVVSLCIIDNDLRKKGEQMETIFKLKATLLDEVTAIVGDEELMRKAINSLRRLRRMENAKVEKEETLVPYTMDEINAMMDESEADEKAGRTISGEEMSRRMEQYIASL